MNFLFFLLLVLTISLLISVFLIISYIFYYQFIFWIPKINRVIKDYDLSNENSKSTYNSPRNAFFAAMNSDKNIVSCAGI